MRWFEVREAQQRYSGRNGEGRGLRRERGGEVGRKAERKGGRERGKEG